jgi:hypothetical protein
VKLAWLAAAVLAAAAPAHAGGFVQGAFGVQLPAGDSDWTDRVDVSPKLALGAGAIQHGLGGMLSVDWTPEHLTDKYTRPANFDTGASAQRFRILLQGLGRAQIAPRMALEFRGGLGFDLAHASYDYTLLGVRYQDSRTDTGIAFEVGGGFWYHASSGLELGGQLAVPISHHDAPSQNGSIAFQYTSYDIDLLFGIRAFTH